MLFTGTAVLNGILYFNFWPSDQQLYSIYGVYTVHIHYQDRIVVGNWAKNRISLVNKWFNFVNLYHTLN